MRLLFGFGACRHAWPIISNDEASSVWCGRAGAGVADAGAGAAAAAGAGGGVEAPPAPVPTCMDATGAGEAQMSAFLDSPARNRRVVFG
jgi:hypothetical protein